MGHERQTIDQGDGGIEQVQIGCGEPAIQLPGSHRAALTGDGLIGGQHPHVIEQVLNLLAAAGQRLRAQGRGQELRV